MTLKCWSGNSMTRSRKDKEDMSLNRLLEGRDIGCLQVTDLRFQARPSTTNCPPQAWTVWSDNSNDMVNPSSA